LSTMGKMNALHMMLLGTTSAFVAGPAARIALKTRAGPPRSEPLVASAKIIPFAYTGLGAALLSRAAAAVAPVDKAVYASAGVLSLCNLAVVDNARYASGKRAVAAYDGKVSLPGAAVIQKGVAELWYSLVRVHLIGQVASLGWMCFAARPAGVLAGAAMFMATNVLLFLLGGGNAKHDDRGLPVPIKPSVQRFVLTTDAIIMSAVAAAAMSPPGSAIRSLGALLFVAGCLIGTAEGLPQTIATLKALASSE
jgi:hypothetical protein